MTNTLVSAVDLTDFPGSPFPDTFVDVAAQSVRNDAGWHIAPEVTETVTIESHGNTRDLVLPSRRVSAVTAVTSPYATITDWTLVDGQFLHRRWGWPYGPITVTLTHGYPSIPADLLPVVVARLRAVSSSHDPAIASRTVGPHTESYRDVSSSNSGSLAVPSRYSTRVGVA